jgi:hypothetical protein
VIQQFSNKLMAYGTLKVIKSGRSWFQATAWVPACWCDKESSSSNVMNVMKSCQPRSSYVEEGPGGFEVRSELSFLPP